MNKIFKVIWNEARNAYVVVSEIAKNHGSKSCSTKKLLAMLIATGVMTCASFDVLAEKPVAATTAAQQYVALKAADFPATGPSWRDKDTWGGLGTYIDARDEWKAQQDGKKQIGKYTYTYDGTNKYWVRKGYVLTVDENGGKYTQLSQKDVRADVAYTGTGVPEGILQSVTSTVEYNGVVTHSGDSLQKVTAGSYAGVSNSGGTGFVGSWNYIIKDSSWEGSVDAENHQDGYVDLIGNKMPKGFITTGSGLEWDEAKQTYTYQGKAVDYRNMYVIDGKLGVFTNANGSEVYTGTVYGKNNEILMTVKDNGKFYSYWAASVTDPSATMETYPVSKYNSDLAVIDQNIKDLNKDIIKEVTLTKGDDSAIIRLVRNGGNAVDGAITVTSGGGTDGKDTFVKISNAADTEGKNFATGSKVEAIVDNGATTGIKINGEDYTIKSGSKVSVTQTADKKTTTITVDGTETTITDTDTTYTAGNGIAIDKTNKNAISVKLKEGENNLEVTEAGLALKKALTVESVKAGDFYMSTAGIGYDDKAYITSSGLNANSQKITGVAAGEAGTDAVNVSQLNKVSAAAKTEVVKGTNIASVGETTATDGHTVYTVNAKGTSVSVDGNFNLVETTDAATNVTNYGISLKDSVTIGGTHAVTINGTDGTVTGLTNTTWNKDSITSGRAATEDQLHAVATEAGKHTTLSNGKNTTVESTVKDGQTDYKVNVAGDLTDITSVANGDSKINLNKDSIIISNGNKSFAITNSGIGMSYITADHSKKSIMLGENGTTISGGLNVAGSKITGVAAGEAYTDAVNVGQLNAAVQAGNTDTHIKAGKYGVGTDNKVNMQLVDKNGKDAGTVTITDVAKASDVGNVNDIADDLKNGGEGKTTVVEAVNKLNTKVGDLQYSKVKKGEIENGDSTTTAIGKLNQKLTDVAATAAKHTTVTQGDNITVTKSDKPNENGGENYNVALNKDIKLDSVTTGDTVMNNDGVKVGTDVSLNKGGLKVGDKVSVSATAVTAGQTSINNDGLAVGPNTSLKADELKVDGKTYIDKNGLNANGMQITNVADGKENSDAVNVGQLKESEKTINNRIDGVENQVISNSNRINQLGNRVNKVGAGAAALAALHPMDFDPDDKLTFSAGYGNYGGENAAAIGAYYRPDEKVMFSVAGTVGNGENMVNAGVSFALDRTNHVSNSRTALAREVIDLRGQLAVMGAKMAKMEKALGMLDETKTKLFPDIPANHWAYEYIAKLAGNGYIEGYPDGNFGGDRLMTRYEFAAMLYRAIEKGAALEEKIIKEFEPELGRIRVDRISGEDGDRDKIERVRVNDTKGERDHYGNKLAK